MRKLNKREIRSMEAYMSRRYEKLWKERVAREDRKDEYKAKCKVMHLSREWFFAHSEEITTIHVNSYADTMEEVLDMEEHTDEYKAGWCEAVKEVEGFMKWMLEWQGVVIN